MEPRLGGMQIGEFFDGELYWLIKVDLSNKNILNLTQIEAYSVGVNSDYPSLYFHIRGRQLNDNGGITNALLIMMEYINSDFFKSQIIEI